MYANFFSDYSILKIIIIAELLIILLLLVGTYFIKIFEFIKTRFDDEQKQYIRNVFQKALTNDKFLLKEKKLKRLDLLIFLITEFDKKYQSSAWIQLRETIVNNVMLPIAEKKAKSKFWRNRLIASECFDLASDRTDENIILLLDDPIPIIHLNAAFAAVKRGSPLLINKLLDVMSQERRLNQTLHVHIFETIQADKLPIIEQRLSHEKNKYVRMACYRVLMNFTYIPVVDIGLNKDLASENIDLKISAMKYLTHLKQNDAIEKLISFLNDEIWQIRAIALQLLGQLKETSNVIEHIAFSLRDPVWWVRINSAKALLNLGEQGRKILKSQDPKVDKYAYETAQYILQR